MNVVALLPWWAGVALAILSYLVLSSMAAQPLNISAASPSGAPTPSLASGVVFNALAGIGQYFLPLIFLAGSVFSALRRRERRQVLSNAAQAPATAALDGMSWQDFEMLVGEAFRRQGYQVQETGGGGADGGVDLVLSRPARNGTEKTLVQCKHWRAFKVGVDVVRELYGAMAARGATAGIVVTSGRYTAEAEAFAQGRNVKLIDGPALQRLIQAAQSGKPATQADGLPESIRRIVEPGPARVAPPPPPPASAPSCPNYGKTMVQRTAKRGAQSGSRFWGCPGYPACRGIRPVDVG